MSTGQQPSEEELRAAYEAEIKRIRTEQVVLEQVVSLINLGMRRTGLSAGTEDERDLEQVRVAIEAVRALMALVEQIAAPQAPAIRDALAQLQMAFVRLGGADAASAGTGAGPSAAGQASPAPETPEAPDSPLPPPPAAGPTAPAGQPGGAQPGPAQRSGRLWIPGQ